MARAGSPGGGKGGQGCLSRKANGAKRGAGPGPARRSASLRESLSVRDPAAFESQFPFCVRTGTERPARKTPHHKCMVTRQQPGRVAGTGAGTKAFKLFTNIVFVAG